MKLCNASETLKVKLRLSKSVNLLLAVALFTTGQASGQNSPSPVTASSSVAEPSSIKPTAEPTLQSFLPGTLKDWTVKMNNRRVSLTWVTTVEKNSSRFVVEKSLDGKVYVEAYSIAAAGNSDKMKKYACDDNVTATNGMVYYRLKMVDKDYVVHLSDTRLIRSNDETTTLAIYPNPAVNELRVTVSSAWQGKELAFDIYNHNGQNIRNKKNRSASQTEVMNVSDLPPGIYIVKVSSGGENLIRQFIKSKS